MSLARTLTCQRSETLTSSLTRAHTANMSHTCTHIHLIICTHTCLLSVCSALPLFPQGILAEEAEVGGAGVFWDGDVGRGEGERAPP